MNGPAGPTNDGHASFQDASFHVQQTYMPQFQSQPSRPSSQPQLHPSSSQMVPPPSHQSLNGLITQNPTPIQAQPSIPPQPHPPQPYMAFQMPALVPNQVNLQSHPSQQQHPIPAHNAHNYPKHPVNSVPHPISANAPPHSMVRPSQQQMAQHLMNPQTHIRSQRMLQQQQMQQMLQQQQRYEEVIMMTDPLECFANRNLAIRRYTTNHANMNHILGTHWTVNQLLRGEHNKHVPKRKDVDAGTSETADQRKERLRRTLEEIAEDVKKSELIHQARLNRIQSS